MDTKKEVIGSLASVIGRKVGSFLDTKSPRLVTYRVTSKPFHYVDVDDGDPLHEYPVTASFQFTITMHPDHSVEGVTTMDENATNRSYECMYAGGYLSGLWSSRPAHSELLLLGNRRRVVNVRDYAL